MAGFMLLPLGWILLGVAGSRRAAPYRWRLALPLAFGSVLLLLFLQGLVVIALTGEGDQGGFLATPLVTIGLGWVALGAALCTDRGLRDGGQEENGS